ncbi:MAG TPA: BamA/TamA family outer membrane protein [Steroidobacteraceae bacterium]|nr:BamA/TamA family outer membrane protein [Steroidobacteraceae bacterium]
MRRRPCFGSLLRIGYFAGTALLGAPVWGADAPAQPPADLSLLALLEAPPSSQPLLAQLQPPTPPAAPPPAPGQPGPPAPAPPPAPVSGFARWFNPSSAPFIPVPEIAVDPNSGTTLGLIPTWLKTDDNHDIRQIIAPDLIHNPYFGWGAHGRVFNYDSADEQWSVVGGIQQRVERELDAEYQVGRTRQEAWSFNGSVIYGVDGTPRFYGVGNGSPAINQTNYTAQTELLQGQIGYNFTHALQLQYTLHFQDVDVLPGTLANIASTDTRFADVLGVHTNKELLNQLAVVYDTRDDIIIPTRGYELVAYGGAASRDGIPDASMFTEAGFDGRGFWPVAPRTILAAHMALRYLPGARDVPFWALSSIGGANTVIGGEQPLRGYGEGRFYDRDSFSSSVELRHKVLSVNAVSTSIDVELAPFIDVGRVFHNAGTVPLDDLHKVIGMGFRGIAAPFVVGYVDIGYGSEGAAVFTGLNYPF